jgi:hypothetical protein
MRLFDYVKSKGADVTRIDGVLFSIFLVENTMNFQNFLKDLSPSEPFMFDHGWGNGYVGLPSWHPYYNMDYDSIPIDCHGGLTFGQLDEDEDLWVIGFDTSHFGDNKLIWTKNRIQEECERIVEQCTELKESQRVLKLKKLNELRQI